MVRTLGESFDGWRDHVLIGEVNDGNTFYALDGISSHAGLFSSAPDLMKFATMYLRNGAGILSPATIVEATSNQTDGLERSRGLGWELLRKGRQARAEWAAAPNAPRSIRPLATAHRHRAHTATCCQGGRSATPASPVRHSPSTWSGNWSLSCSPIAPTRMPPMTLFASVRPVFHNLVAASLL